MIVIDSGFSPQSLRDANVIAICDLRTGIKLVGEPSLRAEQLSFFANDPQNHGSIVLEKLRAFMPQSPVILIRAIDDDGNVIRTRWHNGQVCTDGWSEAYLWAVEICRQRGMTSVANCSFGGIAHAADGTGWEAFQISQVTGAGKAGHVLVAAAGPGDGRAVHASWFTEPGTTTLVEAGQGQSTEYNFWAGSAHQRWWLTARLNGAVVGHAEGENLDGNIWNHRQQLTFRIEGRGHVSFEFAMPSDAKAPLQCECFCHDTARFANHIDTRLVTEPAAFPQVIAVGLLMGSYGGGNKPELFVAGNGAISFHTPMVTAAVAKILLTNPEYDVEKVLQVLHHPHG